MLTLSNRYTFKCEIVKKVSNVGEYLNELGTFGGFLKTEFGGYFKCSAFSGV